METGVSDGASFQDIDLDSSQSKFGRFLDTVCPYFISWGMSWSEFWNSSLDRLAAYWQANQFSIERRNQELWVQGMYIMEAVAAVLDTKHKAQYPKKPYRLTEMTEMEREAENRRKIENLRSVLEEHKRRWDAKRKGADAG